MKSPISIILVILAFAFGACQQGASPLTIFVENALDFERKEVVSLDREMLEEFLRGRSESGLLVRSKGSDDPLVTQWVDLDVDGENDQLLFQVVVDAKSTAEYEISWDAGASDIQQESELRTFSRFVPERTDDYTWENDRVAFRTFGPEAERMVVEGERGGTLTSGIDLWLKRVEYSIIDKWYEGYASDPGFYHIDHGEGYDPYHVGKSRGTGGIGVWTEDTLVTSRNFTAYRKIAEGPLRTIFELDYAPWSDYKIRETKRISLDLGSNFSKFEISLTAEGDVPNYAIGITTHEGGGEINLNPDQGWFRHWESIDDAYLGEGVVLDPSLVLEAFAHKSTVPDQSQVLILTEPKDNLLTYYAGFGWTKSGQVASKDDWDLLLKQQAKRIESPLKVTLNP